MSQELDSKQSSFDGEQRKEASQSKNNFNLTILLLLSAFISILAAYQYSLSYKTINTNTLQCITIQAGNVIKKEESQNYREVTNILDYAPIYSGEIHYSRIPKEYWEHRLLMVKALGFNSISVYVFWNYHQIQKGVFDFRNGEKDLIGFLDLAKKHKLNVLLRPGPYVCAEWDFGGLPARLLGIDKLAIRSSNFLYEEEVLIYFSALSQILKPYLQINGGNIILIQIENEFGSFSLDYQHTDNLLQMWRNLGVECNFYYQDAYENWFKHYFRNGSIGLSGGDNVQQYTSLQTSNFFNKKLIFGGQVYTGWLTHWGEHWNGLAVNDFRERFQLLRVNNKSFSLYMVHGGSNFGLSAGANDFRKKSYMPHITSYDYDSPISQQGRPTEKYDIIRTMMDADSQIPKPIKTISIPRVSLNIQANLLSNLPNPSKLSSITYFQSDELKMYHQGIVIYETTLPAKGDYSLQVIIHDFGIFFVDGQFQGTIMRKVYDAKENITVRCKMDGCVLKIMVEAMGHVNYGQLQVYDKKGLHFLEIIEYPNLKLDWKAYRVLLNNTNIFSWRGLGTQGPTLFKGSFDLPEIGDTFFKMKQFSKGYIWVNDHLLGRYWNIGPQQRIFCPGVWLKNKSNKVQILQLLSTDATTLSSSETLV